MDADMLEKTWRAFRATKLGMLEENTKARELKGQEDPWWASPWTYQRHRGTPRTAKPLQERPNTTKPEEPGCTPRKESSWCPKLAKLARITKGIISGKTREEKATNTTELKEQSWLTRRELSWHPGFTKLARITKELTSSKARVETEPNKTGLKCPCPNSPPSPGLPSGITRAPPGNLAATPELFEELGSLLQAPDSSYSIESSSCISGSGLDADSSMTGLLSDESSPPSDEPSSSSSESSFDTCKSSLDINEPRHPSEVARKKTYVKTRKKKAPDKAQNRALATQ